MITRFDRRQTQDRDDIKHFELFPDSFSNHQGVIGVISGGNIVKNCTKIVIFVNWPIVISPSQWFTTIHGLQVYDWIIAYIWNSFQIHYATTHQRVIGVISGVKLWLKNLSFRHLTRRNLPHLMINRFDKLQSQDRDKNKHFKLFSDSSSNHQGVIGVISGGNIVQNG